MKPPMLTLKQCAERMSVDESTVRKLVGSGRLRAAKIGNWRVDEADLEAFIASKVNTPATPVDTEDGIQPLADSPFA